MEFNPSFSNVVPHQILIPNKGEGYDKIVVKVDGVYKAQNEEGPFTGVGTYKFDGKSFCGKFEEGRFTFGTWDYSEKISYHGDFENDVPNGQGIITYLFEKSVSLTFRGRINNGITDPRFGELTYSDGTVYTGTFFPSRMDIPTPSGRGKLTYNSGDAFEGEFSLGYPDDGQMIINGQKQTGRFKCEISDSNASVPIHHTLGRYVEHRSGKCREGNFIADQIKRGADGELTTDAISTKRMKHS